MARGSGRRTNLALLTLVPLALGTGAACYAVGSGPVRPVVVAHGAAGLSLLLLLRPKSRVVARGLRRSRAGKAASVALGIALTIAIASGITHATGLARDWGPLTALQLHVVSALLAIPFFLQHVVIRRVAPHRADLSRRSLLQAGGVLAGAGALYGAVEGGTHLLHLPGTQRRATGSYRTGWRNPDAMPVTQWVSDGVPDIDPASWRLRAGLRRLSITDLQAYADSLTATLDCTGGWYAEQDWTGLFVHRLFDEAAWRHARSVEVVSVTGYRRRLPPERGLLLATAVGGDPLSAGHGAPARLVAPGRRGFWWVKWVQHISLSDIPWWLQTPFPLQ